MTEVVSSNGEGALVPPGDSVELGLNRCFVVGPIGNKFAQIGSPSREAYEDALEVFEKVIVPACQAFDLDPVRADQIAASGAVTEQVLRHLHDDEIVIADVSGGNPNVMYELGLRHTRNLLTILIGEYGQLPFDIADIRTIQFSKSDRGLIDARKALERAIRSGLDELPEPIAATRLWNLGQEVVVKPEAKTASEAEGAEITPSDAYFEEKGVVERFADIEESFPVLTEISGSIASILNNLGEVATSSNEELDVASAATQSTRARLTVIAKFAQALQPHADELALQTTRFHNHMEGMDDELIALLAYLERHPELQEVEGFLDSIIEMAKSAREAMENIGGFGTVVLGLGELSRALKRPAHQIGQAVEVMTSSVKFTDEWDRRARTIKQLRAAGAS